MNKSRRLPDFFFAAPLHPLGFATFTPTMPRHYLHVTHEDDRDSTPPFRHAT